MNMGICGLFPVKDIMKIDEDTGYILDDRESQRAWRQALFLYKLKGEAYGKQVISDFSCGG